MALLASVSVTFGISFAFFFNFVEWRDYVLLYSVDTETLFIMLITLNRTSISQSWSNYFQGMTTKKLTKSLKFKWTLEESTGPTVIVHRRFLRQISYKNKNKKCSCYCTFWWLVNFFQEQLDEKKFCRKVSL